MIKTAEQTVDRKFMTLKETAQYLGLGYSTVKRNYPQWRESGVTAHRFGKHVFFKIEEIDRMIESNRIN